MLRKHIAIGIGVIIVVAAIGAGIAFAANSNDDNNDFKIPDISGKWNLAYIEIANMYDPTTGKAITSAKDVTVSDHHINPYETDLSIDITDVGKHGFKGKFISVNNEHDIHGTVNVAAIKFAVEANGFLYLFEGGAKDGYLSGAMVKIKPSTTAGVDTVVCGLSYMLFIHDGGKPVPIRSDYFDMSMMKAGTYIKSTLHEVSDFTEGKRTGEGREVGSTLEFVKAHNMISVFSVSNKNGEMGVQVVASMGPTPNGTVSGILAGNLNAPVPDRIWTIRGNMVVAHEKAFFLHHLHHNEMGLNPEYVEIEYNVPYKKGGDLTPVYIKENVEYKGTTVVKYKDKEPESVEESRKFHVHDNTFYSEVAIDGGKAIWLGEIYGHFIDIYVMNLEKETIGRLTGHVDRDGTIHLFGIMIDKNGDASYHIEFTLKPV